MTSPTNNVLPPEFKLDTDMSFTPPHCEFNGQLVSILLSILEDVAPTPPVNPIADKTDDVEVEFVAELFITWLIACADIGFVRNDWPKLNVFDKEVGNEDDNGIVVVLVVVLIGRDGMVDMGGGGGGGNGGICWWFDEEDEEDDDDDDDDDDEGTFINNDEDEIIGNDEDDDDDELLLLLDAADETTAIAAAFIAFIKSSAADEVSVEVLTFKLILVLPSLEICSLLLVPLTVLEFVILLSLLLLLPLLLELNPLLLIFLNIYLNSIYIIYL